MPSLLHGRATHRGYPGPHRTTAPALQFGVALTVGLKAGRFLSGPLHTLGDSGRAGNGSRLLVPSLTTSEDRDVEYSDQESALYILGDVPPTAGLAETSRPRGEASVRSCFMGLAMKDNPES